MVGAGEVITGVDILYRFLKKYSERGTRRFERTRDEVFREWVSELALAMRTHGAQHGHLEAQVTALSARIDDPAYKRAVEILERESELEPTLERRRMLAYTAAGWVNLELSTARLSRVLRVVRELEPVDVELLNVLAHTGDQERPREDFEPSPEGVQRHDILMDHQPSGDVLVATGCVAVRYTTGLNNQAAEAHVTEIGRWVLQALDPFIRACAEDEQFPERPLDQLAKSLPPGADRDRIAGYQDLADLAQQVKARGFEEIDDPAAGTRQ